MKFDNVEDFIEAYNDFFENDIRSNLEDIMDGEIIDDLAFANLTGLNESDYNEICEKYEDEIADLCLVANSGEYGSDINFKGESYDLTEFDFGDAHTMLSIDDDDGNDRCYKPLIKMVPKEKLLEYFNDKNIDLSNIYVSANYEAYGI